MTDEAKYKIPQHLDAPFKIILWTTDEFLAFAVPFIVLFFFFNAPISATALGALLVIALKKLKGEQGHFFLYNLMYWYFPEVIKFKATPPSYKRHLIG